MLTISLIATMVFPVNSHALSSIEKVVYFYPCINTGYLIVDADTLKPIEFSPENSLDFFNNTQRRYYYGVLL